MSTPDFGLGGKVAVVTGGAAGIGASIASMFAAAGATVAIADVRGDEAELTAVEIGNGCVSYQCDVTDRQSATTVADDIAARFGGIDILVNNAGVALLGPAETLPEEAWGRTLAVNLTGTFLMSQAVGRHMLEKQHGKIINLASQAASVALPEHAAYSASKAGVLGLTRVLAYEWAGRGITVNAISPTVVLTELGRTAWSGAKGEAMRARIPTGRFAEPDEVAAAALYLASGLSDMVTGADLPVDGGYTIQ